MSSPSLIRRSQSSLGATIRSSSNSKSSSAPGPPRFYEVGGGCEDGNSRSVRRIDYRPHLLSNATADDPARMKRGGSCLSSSERASESFVREVSNDELVATPVMDRIGEIGEEAGGDELSVCPGEQ